MGEHHRLRAGELTMALRPETPGDQPFLKALFAASRAAPLLMAGLPRAQVDGLLDMQHRGQTMSYASLYPNGRFRIVELDGAPVGRLVEDDEADAIYVVDIAIAPEAQRHGLARALIGDVQARAAARGLGVRAQVSHDNAASAALFTACGFVSHGQAGEFQDQFNWR